jgi:hypothetical protein
MPLHRISLVAVACAACGLDTFAISDGDISGLPQQASFTSAPPPSDEPTTSAFMTTGATTAEPAETAETADAVDNCELAPECQAGAVEDGEQCDGCGVLRRSCQADCTWTPITCQEDLDTCAYWRLPAGELAWERVPVDPNAQFAPKSPVLAAFDLEPQQQIYVFTAEAYHVLSTSTLTWDEAGTLDTLFPALPKPIVWAASLNVAPPKTLVTIHAGTAFFQYTFVAETFVMSPPTTCCGEEWTGPNAPASPNDLRDGWGLDAPDGWFSGDPQEVCGLGALGRQFGYHIYIGDGFVHPENVGFYANNEEPCFAFYPKIPYTEFTPFTYPGAPPNDLVGGAASLDGLWIFRGE